jgi:hypothetical protein
MIFARTLLDCSAWWFVIKAVVDHEYQKIVVWIVDGNAGTGVSAPTLRVRGPS